MFLCCWLWGSWSGIWGRDEGGFVFGLDGDGANGAKTGIFVNIDVVFVSTSKSRVKCIFGLFKSSA